MVGAMSTLAAYCTSSGDTLMPTALARSPWGQTIAGHVVGGLLARAIERVGGDPEFQPSRLTVDLIRPAALKPVEVVANIVHGGQRIRLVDAILIQEGSGRECPDEIGVLETGSQLLSHLAGRAHSVCIHTRCACRPESGRTTT